MKNYFFKLVVMTLTTLLFLATFGTGAPLTTEVGPVLETSLITAADAELTRRATYGTCIDLCLDANYENCRLNYCTNPNVCIHITWGGLSSIRFTGNMQCLLFINGQCAQSVSSNWYVATQSIPDLRLVGFNDIIASIQCVRFSPEQSGNATIDGNLAPELSKKVTTGVALTPKVSLAANTDMAPARRDLGTCIDLCLDPNYQNCEYNICTPPHQCMNVVDGDVSSIRFFGNMQCLLFEVLNCKATKDPNWYTATAAVPDLGPTGFDNRVVSFKCVRWS